MLRHTISLGFLMSLLAVSTAYAGWVTPIVVGPPISTTYQDYSPYLTSDGKTMYLSSDRPGTMGDRDLWVSQKVSGVWQTPINLGSAINTSYEEHDPMVDATGTLIFFSSNRPSPYGGWWPWHLYFSRKVNGLWQPAQDLGAPVNSSSGEECPFLFTTSRDTFLYFATYCRHGGQGEWDIWVSHRYNGQWENPTNLGVPINTGQLDAAPFLTKHASDLDGIDCDKVRMYFTSMRPGGSGHIDIWRALRIDGIWQPPENLGQVVNWSYRSDRPCFVDDDEKNEDAVLYFADDDRQGGIGSWDIWITHEDKGGPSVTEKKNSSNRVTLSICPNPFSSQAEIRYISPLGQPFSVKVFDAAGRLVRTLAEGEGDGSVHEVPWNGRSLSGAPLPNGLYLVKTSSGRSSETRRLLLLR